MSRDLDRRRCRFSCSRDDGRLFRRLWSLSRDLERERSRFTRLSFDRDLYRVQELDLFERDAFLSLDLERECFERFCLWRGDLERLCDVERNLCLARSREELLGIESDDWRRLAFFRVFDFRSEIDDRERLLDRARVIPVVKFAFIYN